VQKIDFPDVIFCLFSFANLTNMKKNVLLCLIFIFFSTASAFSQKSLPDFGEYSEDEKSLSVCSFDKNADAVVLLDEANSYYDDNYRLITARRTRIKILNDRAIEKGNIRIRYYQENGFETIKNLKALSFTPAGNASFITTGVDKKSFFTEKEDKIFSSIKFAIPNVKAGSILEYKYESIMKSYAGLRNWFFQSDIPTYRSCYNLEVIPTAEFNFQVQKKSTYPIILQPKTGEGKVYFEMDNIPGLRFEPYMDAVKDYLQKVEFQLSGYVNIFGDNKSVNQTWRDVAYDLYKADEFCGAFKKDFDGLDELKQLAGQKNKMTGKLVVIYDYLRNHFTWDGIDYKYASDGLKEVWEKKTGHSGEINLLLVNLLQLSDIEAYPMLVAERDFGKIDTVHPFLEQFNKTVAYAIADGKTFILDATQRDNPAGLTPFPLLNTYAFLVDRKKYSLLKIRSADEKYDNLISVNAKLSNKGVLTGSAEISSFQYASVLGTEKIKKGEKKFVKETFMDPYEGIIIDSFHIQKPANIDEPLLQKLHFHNDLNENGGFVLLNYNLFTGLTKNPFTNDIRFTNINFGFPYNIILEEVIELPANSTIDDLPKNRTIKTAANDISISREIKREGNLLKIRIVFIQTNTIFLNRDYTIVKQFYTSMVEMLNEQVDVKLGK